MLLLAAIVAVSPILLSGTFPDEMPSGGALQTWERYGGQAERNGHRIVYELMVNPQRPALFMITRFRIHAAGQTNADDEILIWNARPGARPIQYLRCFARVVRPRVGLLHQWAWEAVPAQTPPYQRAMATAMEIYALHQMARDRARESPTR